MYEPDKDARKEMVEFYFGSVIGLLALLFLFVFITNKFNVDIPVPPYILISIYWILFAVILFAISKKMFNRMKHTLADNYTLDFERLVTVFVSRETSLSGFESGIVSLITGGMIYLVHKTICSSILMGFAGVFIVFLLVMLYLYMAFTNIFASNDKLDFIRHLNVSLITLVICSIIIVIYGNIMGE
jgi:hypothetical protein